MGIVKTVKKKLKEAAPNLFMTMKNGYRTVMHAYRKRIPKEEYPKYLSKKYKKIFGEELNLQHPKKYTEKLQWLKLYDDNPLRAELTDKAAVRDWVAQKIGEEYLIPVVGIYDSVDEIDFDSLPEEYVIKMNHCSGWNIIVNKENPANVPRIKRKIRKWMKLNYAYWNDIEPHYATIKPRIVIEKYIVDSKGELNDYKFLCFDGEVKYFWIDFERKTGHRRNTYDTEWNLQPWNQNQFGAYQGKVEKPQNYDDMLRVAKILCQGFCHVRVDLYNVDGKVYFGEMTFTSASGFAGIYPKEYEYKIGKLIKLPTDKEE